MYSASVYVCIYVYLTSLLIISFSDYIKMIAGHIVLALVFVCVVLDVITSCCVFTTDAV